MDFRKLMTGLLLVAVSVTVPYAATLEDARMWLSDPQVAERIDEGIEQNRKGDVLVQVVDGTGRPIAGAEVTAVQTSHAFLFGCNLFVLKQLETAEQNAKYEEAFTGLFNFASLPFYWKDLEPEPGALRFEEGAPYIWRRPPPDVLLAWCNANGITPKGHPLLWHAINPDWMPKEPEALRAAYVKRFKEIAERYAAAIPIWDVVNESIVCKEDYPFYSEDRAYVAWAFGEAHKVFPDADLLMINEVMTVSHQPIEKNQYYKQVESLLKAGTGIEGIGFQFHYFDRAALDKGFFGNPHMTPKALLDVYEAFDSFGLPLYITEITIPGSGEEGPAVQAEVVRNLYRLWFSVKRMAGVTWWNLGDKMAYGSEDRAMGGLVDEDLNPKPAYEVLDQLINHEWRTEFKGRTDAEGRCRFRGFAGAYSVEVTTADGSTWRDETSIKAGQNNEHKLKAK